jgi:membrane protease YdiL (CAAX protease family)
MRGVVVYSSICLFGMTALAAAMKLAGLELAGAGGAAVIAAMWIPALARAIAVRTVDREFKAPFPLRRWGRPGAAIVVVPLVSVAALYLLAYGASGLFGVMRTPPVWRGAGKVAINVAINLPPLAAIGLLGGMGEELGWRGYLQPRLDQLRVPYSLLVTSVVETAYHLPFILWIGYLESSSRAASVALFLGLSLGIASVWTVATYRTRSIWTAAWFHAFHNGFSQVIVPRALGAGDELTLGESGIFPVVVYLIAAAAVLLALRAGWRDFAARHVDSP